MPSEDVLTSFPGVPWQPDEERRDREQFRGVIRLLSIVAVAVGVEGVVLAIATDNLAVLAMSLVLASFAAWVVWAGPQDA